jgi:hypothetical protein
MSLIVPSGSLFQLFQHIEASTKLSHEFKSWCRVHKARITAVLRPDLARRGVKEYVYAARNRPPGYATIPTGVLRILDRDERIPAARHGFAVYDRPLTDDEIKSYELLLVVTPEDLAKRIADSMEYVKEYLEEHEKDPRFFAQAIGQKMHEVGDVVSPASREDIADRVLRLMRQQHEAEVGAVVPLTAPPPKGWYRAGRDWVDAERGKRWAEKQPTKGKKSKPLTQTDHAKDAMLEVMHEILNEGESRDTEERFKAMKLDYLSLSDSTKGTKR